MAERRPWVRVSMRWWEQAGIDIGQGETGTETNIEKVGEYNETEGEAEVRRGMEG